MLAHRALSAEGRIWRGLCHPDSCTFAGSRLAISGPGLWETWVCWGCSNQESTRCLLRAGLLLYSRHGGIFHQMRL